MTSAPERIETPAGGKAGRGVGGVLWIAAPLVLPVVLIALWHIAVAARWVPPTLIASPADVLANLIRLAGDGTLAVHVWASLWRLIQGFGLGAAAGLMIGCWIGLSWRAERFLAPTIGLLAPIPPTAWIPLLIILLGFGEPSKIWLIAIGVFFVVATNTISGIRNVDVRLVEVATIYRKSRLEVLSRILLPASLPSILMGLRLGLGLSWILLIAAELISAQKGIGWFVYDFRNFSRPADMISGMVCIGILGMASDWMMVALQRRLLRWQATFGGR